MLSILILYFLTNSGLIILIKPARHTRPDWGVTPCSCNAATIFSSYSQPFTPSAGITFVGTPYFSEAIFSPAASGLFEITTDGLTFFIWPDLISERIASFLLPLPEIRMPRLIKLHSLQLAHA